MVVGTRLLSLNRSTKQSRLLSVATSHCRSQSTLSHLVHLSDQIYAENPTLYKCLRPPDINFRPLVAEGESEHEEAMISDWNEVLDTVQCPGYEGGAGDGRPALRCYLHACLDARRCHLQVHQGVGPHRHAIQVICKSRSNEAYISSKYIYVV